MILLWGLAEDGPLGVVCAELDRLGADVVYVDQRLGIAYEMEVDDPARTWLCGPDIKIDLESLVAACARPYNFTQLYDFANLSPEDLRWRRMAHFEATLSGWCDTADALVVNRPTKMGSNSSKPYQQEVVIRSVGFRTPVTLLTTDPEEVRRFRAEHSDVIYKSISGWRSIVKRLSDEDVETIADVQCCPTQFQAYVEGIDYRVHVVGNEVFAARIRSCADDYRYASDTDIEPVELDPLFSGACVRLCQRLKLHLGGIDLRQDRDGEWFCFEINPSPCFTCFDRDGYIARSLASQLVKRGPIRHAKGRTDPHPVADAREEPLLQSRT